MSQKELSVIAEFGLGLVAIENETTNLDLILQYYSEEQLELFAKSTISERDLNELTRDGIRNSWKNFVDTASGKLPPFREQLDQQLSNIGIHVMY
ncbi:MAG: hypothetical protein HDR50_12065 [Desulfovibrio sp.]|uniref:hypothetical protein n=1 Tax=Desulfovibrio sp. TaxID=885 RepID=UPI001A6CC95A|nr:hypothetical protein [Desulfovibrio sp.]MBD5418347.1 hypothetical protein [Desulfovibrio sp.]